MPGGGNGDVYGGGALTAALYSKFAGVLGRGDGGHDNVGLVVDHREHKLRAVTLCASEELVVLIGKSESLAVILQNGNAFFQLFAELDPADGDCDRAGQVLSVTDRNNRGTGGEAVDVTAVTVVVGILRHADNGRIVGFPSELHLLGLTVIRVGDYGNGNAPGFGGVGFQSDGIVGALTGKDAAVTAQLDFLDLASVRRLWSRGIFIPTGLFRGGRSGRLIGPFSLQQGRGGQCEDHEKGQQQGQPPSFCGYLHENAPFSSFAGIEERERACARSRGIVSCRRDWGC